MRSSGERRESLVLVRALPGQWMECRLSPESKGIVVENMGQSLQCVL